ncbi:UPF0047 protein C4A8.02c-like isoform X2 [Actinidia eriantha]|uniref:UPF0047 protein C4A8.02c-like isoform X2 n=1 Tax=Actinidia eriantha TaxID=165200 RepID=UPI002582995C|nr:UPF0047 protein C4A8.02c-like isoform X2 [Actinidia eriantha]
MHISSSSSSSSVFLSAKSRPSPLWSPIRIKSLHTTNTPNTTSAGYSSNSMAAKWAQKTITLPPQRRVQHTSASLTINENYDSDVRDDTETFLNKIVPEGMSAPWKHTLEGPDDMPAHIKSSMFGCTLMIPIVNGQLNMGTWQGIWLCEHRDLATARNVVVTLNGI